MAERSQEPSAGFGGIVRRLGPVSALAAVAMIFPPIGGLALLAYREPAAQWLVAHPSTGLAYYVLGFTILAGLALLPTYAQAILAGYAFHFASGFPAALAGFTGAALVGFAIARYASGDRALRLVSEYPKWKVVHDSLLGRGWLRTFGLISLLRLPTNSPFALTNLALAAANVPWTAYALGTVIGMAPRTAAAVYIGTHLKSLDDPSAPTWYFWVGLGVSLAVLAIIGFVTNRAVQRVGGWHVDRPAAVPAAPADSSAEG